MQFERLGPYKIGKRLGHGGMGAVFEGVNVEAREPAAVKVLSPHLADDEGFRERFELEIETLKKLRHPNIVRMYGFGEEGGYLYYAMELVKGHSVEEELQLGRRFTWREVVQHSVKLLKALRHAHDHGVIHRDLKPANLLLADDGNEIKLTDFGIARLWANNRLNTCPPSKRLVIASRRKATCTAWAASCSPCSLADRRFAPRRCQRCWKSNDSKHRRRCRGL